MRNSRTGTILATALLSTGLLVATATLHGQATASAVLEGTILDTSQAAVGGSRYGRSADDDVQQHRTLSV